VSVRSRSRALPWLVTAALVVALVGTATRARSDAAEWPGAVAVPGLALGAYLAVQVWFLQSPVIRDWE
jgi:hypothetical protein